MKSFFETTSDAIKNGWEQLKTKTNPPINNLDSASESATISNPNPATTETSLEQTQSPIQETSVSNLLSEQNSSPEISPQIRLVQHEEDKKDKEPPCCHELRVATDLLKLKISTYNHLLHKNPSLLTRCANLLQAAEQATSINVIFSHGAYQVKQANIVDCYTWTIVEQTYNEETKESNAPPPISQFKLSYIPIDGSIISSTISTTINLVMFLEERRIPFYYRREMYGASPSVAIFQSFLKKVGLELTQEFIQKINTLTQLIKNADDELAYYVANSELNTIIASEPSIEYPPCEVYFTDIPQTKQSNYRDCYIWNGIKLVYIPPELSDDRAFEDVPITNITKLLEGFNQLTLNPYSQGHITLPNTQYVEIIQSNGGHTYHARKEHDTLFNDAKKNLDDITNQWVHHSQTAFDIVYTKPNANQKLEPNTLYIYEENSTLYYTLRSIPTSDARQTHEPVSLFNRLKVYLGIEAQPTSIHLTENIITGVLDLKDNIGLKTQLTQVIACNQPSTTISEDALWNRLYAQNKNINPTYYHPKNQAYLQTTIQLTKDLTVCIDQLKKYINDQTDNLQARCDIEKVNLRRQINDDEVFNSLTHNIATPRIGIQLYKECLRLYNLRPEDPHKPKTKRLAQEINKHIGIMLREIDEFKSNCLPVSELPIVLRKMNAPAPIQAIEHTERQFNVSLMILGVALISASIALFFLSHGLSTPLSYAGINLGTHLLFNMTLAGLASGACAYATGVFFGPKKILATTPKVDINPVATTPRGSFFP